MVEARTDVVERLSEPTETSIRPAATDLVEVTADVLAALPDGWTVLDDVSSRGARFTPIDHVVVGPSGIFVVVAARWQGTVTVVDNVVRHDRQAREADTDQCADAALAVAEVVQAVDAFAEWVLPVLCLERAEPVLDWAVDVRVCSTATLVEALTSLPPVLSPRLVAEAVVALGDGAPGADEDAPTVPTMPVLSAAAVPAADAADPTPAPVPDRAEITALLTPVESDPAPTDRQSGPVSGRRARAAARAEAAAAESVTVDEAPAARPPAAAEEVPARAAQGARWPHRRRGGAPAGDQRPADVHLRAVGAHRGAQRRHGRVRHVEAGNRSRVEGRRQARREVR